MTEVVFVQCSLCGFRIPETTKRIHLDVVHKIITDNIGADGYFLNEPRQP